MTITEIPTPSDKLARHWQLENMQFTVTLNGREAATVHARSVTEHRFQRRGAERR